MIDDTRDRRGRACQSNLSNAAGTELIEAGVGILQEVHLHPGRIGMDGNEIIGKAGILRRSRWERKKVEMLFAHPKRIRRLDRLRLRGPCGARDEFHLAAAVQNLRKLAKFVPVPSTLLPG
jgi:hypothetical protein